MCVAALTVLQAQTVDTTVCEILSNPQSFDGKIVRVKGTVIAGFHEFAIRDSSCKQPVNGIWLCYPEGTKAKAGPAALLQLQLAKNSPRSVAPRTEYLSGSTRTKTSNSTSGSAISFRKSAARKSTTVRPQKRQPMTRRGGPEVVILSLLPIKLHGHSSRAHQGRNRLSRPRRHLEGRAKTMVLSSVSAFRTVSKGDGAKGDGNSPDGLLLNCTFDMDRLKGDALSKAIVHVGMHIADLRSNQADPGPARAEYRAWQTTLLSAVATRQKTLIMPGGYVVGNASWPPDDRDKRVDEAISNFLAAWSPFGR